ASAASFLPSSFSIGEKWGLMLKFQYLIAESITRRRAADSTDSTARRDNEVRLFFWIGINYQAIATTNE
ncbi:hypothetical protein, partial [Uruburuella suis]|uniref:hypothetical protein n=1 Tax=Uruburuella suis TaxID=252130 RepID=UPI001A9D3CBB